MLCINKQENCLGTPGLEEVTGRASDQPPPQPPEESVPGPPDFPVPISAPKDRLAGMFHQNSTAIEGKPVA